MKISDLNHLSTALGPKIIDKESSYLYFGGTAYLGIPRNENFVRHYVNGIGTFGLNNGTSRSNNVQLGIYEEAEEIAAQRFGAESALITSSGYLAAQLTIKHLSGWGELLYAPATHPALWLNGDPKVSGDFSSFCNHGVNLINSHKHKRWVIISNSLNNLVPEQFDFSFLKEIDPDKELVLMVDDSHGIGILNDGNGCFKSLPKIKNLKIVVLASMAKALGVDAGLILGSNEMIRELKQTNEFFGASPPAAAGLFAFMQSEAIYQEELKKLQHLIAYFNVGLGHLKPHLVSIEKFPVYLSDHKDLAKTLQSAQILISSFPYPDQKSDLLNRIVLSSWHTEADLDLLLNILRSCG